MNDFPNHTTNTHSTANDRPDLDVLVTRVIDAEASVEDWSLLRDLASVDATVWQQLAESQMQHAQLQRSVEMMLEPADRVEAPVDLALGQRFSARVSSITTWGGWLIAAMVLLTFVVGRNHLGFSTASPNTNAPNTAGLVPDLFSSPEDALQKYIDMGKQQGTVLDQVPDRMLLATRPTADDSKIEVIYIRQIVERVVVDKLYNVGQTDTGMLVPTRPVQIERLRAQPVRQHTHSSSL